MSTGVEFAPVFAPQCVLEPRSQQILAPSQFSEVGQKMERNGMLRDKEAHYMVE